MSKEKILKTLQDFYNGKWGYYIKPIENNTNIIIYIYNENGVKEINVKDWMRKQGLDPDNTDILKVIDWYKELGIIKEI